MMMKKKYFTGKALASAVLTACAGMSGAQAAVLTFDGPEVDAWGENIYHDGRFIGDGEAFSQQGFILTALNSSNSYFAGGVATSKETGCWSGRCLADAKSGYYYGVSGQSTLSIEHGGGLAFKMDGFDAAYVPLGSPPLSRPYRLLFDGISDGKNVSSSVLLPGADADGKYRLHSFDAPDALAALNFTQLRLSACFTDASGACLGSGPDAFALDNLNVTAVPEPGTWALMAAGLAGIGAFRRRQNR